MTDKGLEAAVAGARFDRLCQEFLSATTGTPEEIQARAKAIGAAFKAVVAADKASQSAVNGGKYAEMLRQLRIVAEVAGVTSEQLVPRTAIK